MAVLIGLGMVMLYSSSMNMEIGKNQAAVGAHLLLSQLCWCAIGLIGCLAAAALDYRRLKKAAPWLLGVSLLLLALVFAPVIGIARNGAHRWIGLAGPHFQPSELAKLALILFLASYGDRFQRQMAGFRKGLLLPGVIIAAVLALIFIEPDRGCTILLAAVCGVMLILAGARLRFIVPPAMLLVAGLAVSLLHDSMRLTRIHAWLHPEECKDGVGYQAYEAMIALGSGGWTGLGLGNGRQKLGFVPEHHTDFIFSIIGEELGLVATLAVVLLFIALVVCGFYVARRSSDAFGLLLGAGITSMIGLQAFINMGVVTSMLPNKGMPLPFISYGGSNLVLMLVSVGLLLSISRFAAEPVKPKSNPFETMPEPCHA
ncbi:MAG: putative lipid II flippase FtsW [Verrucomicrobiota bacterium]